MEEVVIPVNVRRTRVMVLRTSVSLSVSMYSDSFPAMKPQRTCPCLGMKDGTESCLMPSLPWDPHCLTGHQRPQERLEALDMTKMLLHIAQKMPEPSAHDAPSLTLLATYCSGGWRTTNPMSFLNQLASRSALGSSRADSSSHTTSRSCCWGSQKGCSNSRKILLLVPKPSR